MTTPHLTPALKTAHAADNLPRMEEMLPPFVPQLFEPDLPLGQLPVETPDLSGCRALWDKYQVPLHIRDHSSQVALIVATLGAKAALAGAKLDRPLILAGALLHDIAKGYTIDHGGSHAQLGGAWVGKETRNFRIAQMVIHHVHWPWEIDVNNDAFLGPLLLIYADKRVRHDSIVSIEERFEDLFARYGHTERARKYIAASKEQGLQIEKALSERLGVQLNEYSFDCRRLV